MSEVPAELKYSKSHEWVRMNDDGTLTVGITDHAQELLGDIVFVELPEEGATIDAEGACAVVESVKAASDIYMPLTGTVLSVNDELADAPETINESAYEAGWIFTMQAADRADLDDLMDADAYAAFADEE